MNISDILINKEDFKPILYQNFLTSKDPGITSKPTPFIRGGEKVYKIGNQYFNYIDYLEAYLHIDCYTYRSRKVLDEIADKIEKAIIAAQK